MLTQSTKLEKAYHRNLRRRNLEDRSKEKTNKGLNRYLSIDIEERNQSSSSVKRHRIKKINPFNYVSTSSFEREKDQIEESKMKSFEKELKDL